MKKIQYILNRYKTPAFGFTIYTKKNGEKFLLAEQKMIDGEKVHKIHVAECSDDTEMWIKPGNGLSNFSDNTEVRVISFT